MPGTTINDSADLLAWLKQMGAKGSPYCLATVQQTNPVYVQFDGDIDETGAAIITPVSMTYLDSYFPTVGDRVLMLRVNATWVILGSINTTPTYPTGYGLFRRDTTQSVPDSTWVETTQDDQLEGNGATDGSPTLSSGHILINAAGYYEYGMLMLWPNAGAVYGRTLVGIAPSGGGSGGPVTQYARNDQFMNSTITHWQGGGVGFPRKFNVGDTLSCYMFQASGASVTIATNSIYAYVRRVG